jgi:hypothetical protein
VEGSREEDEEPVETSEEESGDARGRRSGGAHRTAVGR